MARKSSLPEKHWKEIERRYLEGESARALGREFGVAESTIRTRLREETAQIQAVVKQVIDADRAFNELSNSAQVSAQALINKLRSVSYHSACAAEFGAMTAHRLHGIANSQANAIDDVAPDMEALQVVGRLAAVANEAAKPAFNLLAANKDMLQGSKSERVINGVTVAEIDAELKRIERQLATV